MILLNQFFMDGMKKLCRILMYTCIMLIATSPTSLNDIQPYIINDLKNLLFFFSSSHIYIFNLNSTTQKFQHPHLGQCKFLIFEYHFHPNVLFSHFLWFVFQFWFLFNFSQCKSHFIQPVSYISVTNINSCFNPLVFHWFYYTFSIFKAYCFKFSFPML